MTTKTITKFKRSVLTFVLTIAALLAGQSVWAQGAGTMDNPYQIGDLTYHNTSATEATVTGCNSSATSITIPATVTDNTVTYNVTAIGENAFDDCDELSIIYCLATTVPTLGSDDAFDDCHNDLVIVVPADAYNSYNTDWSDYSSYLSKGYTLTCDEGVTATSDNNGPLVQEDEEVMLDYTGTVPEGSVFGGYFYGSHLTRTNTFDMPAEDVTVTAAISPTSGNCGTTDHEADVTWALTDTDTDGTYDMLTISGTGAMADYDADTQPWAVLKLDINTLIIGEGVTAIGSNAFTGCTNLERAYILPTTLPTTSGNVFDGCDALSAIVVPGVARDRYWSDWYGKNDYPYSGSIIEGYTVTCAEGITVTSKNNGPLVQNNEVVTITNTVPSVAPEGYEAPFLGYKVMDTNNLIQSVTEEAGVYTFPMPDCYATVMPAWTTIPWEGSGSATDPYIIEYASQLDLLAERVNSGTDPTDTKKYEDYTDTYFELGRDIEYAHTTDWNDAASTEKNFTSIGCYKHTTGIYYAERSFNGHFDGKGHRISGIRIFSRSNSYCIAGYEGIFGNIGPSATVSGIILDDTRITGHCYIGGIAGHNDGIISDCHVTDKVNIHVITDGSTIFGGIAGSNNDGTISGCTSAVSITSTTANSPNPYKIGTRIGGIAGSNYSTLKDCLYLGTTLEGEEMIGAIAGSNGEGSSVENSYDSSSALTITLGTNVALGGTATAYTVSGLTAYDNFALKKGTTIYSAEGNTITLGDAPEGYTITSASYNDGSDHEITPDNGVYSFQMPAADVTVSATLSMTWTSIQTALANASTDADHPTVITLDRDVVAGSTDSYLEVPVGHHVIIDLNGHKIDRNMTESQVSGYVILLNGQSYNRASLVIRDSQGGGQITGGFDGTGGGQSAAGGINVQYGDLTLEGGSICGNKCTFGGGGGVRVAGGTFTMTGGSITGNVVNTLKGAANAGGAIYGYIGDIYLRGGSITDNTTYNSSYACGGIAHDNGSGTAQFHLSGTFTLSGNQKLSYDTNTQDWTTVVASDYLHGNREYIILDGPISPTAPIAIDLYSGFNERLTTNWNTHMDTADPDDCFTLVANSESSGKLIGVKDDNLYIGTPEALYWHADADHDGTSEEKAYIISTTAGLDLLATNVNAGNEYKDYYFKLANDITYTYTTAWNDTQSEENNYTAIGYFDNTGPGYYFKGTFDGNNKTISGIRIYKAGTGFIDECQGVFSQLGSEGTVKNLVLANSHITGHGNTGGIVGYSIGTIENCNCLESVTISPNSNYCYSFGGIAGILGGSISNCTSSATIICNANDCSNFGGIAGYVLGGSISNCTSSATTINNGNYCSNFGGIAGGDSNSSSLIGNLVINASFSDETNPGAISGGEIVNGTLKNNYYSGCTVDGNPMAYGVGYYGGDITENDGAVPATILSETQASMPAMNENDKVVFRREFTGGKASTICLPFAMTDIEGGKVYKFVDVTYNQTEGWVATMSDATPGGNNVTSTEANKPYLFLPEGSGSVPVLFYGTASASVSAGTTTSGDWTFYGTYTNLTFGTGPMTGNIYGFAAKSKTVDGHEIEAGDFVHAKEGASVPPMRCYLTYKNGAQLAPMRASALGATGSDTEAPSRITVRLVSASGTVTAVGTLDTVTGEMDIDTWYDMSGRLLETEPTAPGLYIHKGKTIMIKE